MAAKGDWVQIEATVLEPLQRMAGIPEDTKKTPLTLWVKGFLQGDAEEGAVVEVETLTGRRVQGRLVDPCPWYDHNYGKLVPELLQIGIDLRKRLQEAQGE